MLREINPVDFDNVKNELADLQEMFVFFRESAKSVYDQKSQLPFVDMIRIMSEEKITEIQNVIDDACEGESEIIRGGYGTLALHNCAISS